MDSTIHRDSLSAWNALCGAGRLDIEGRDADLVDALRKRIDVAAPNLESALAGATVEQFLSALFSSIQPFVSMFRDILEFFEKAAAVHGQSQWRISVGDEFLDFRHFREFLEHWNTMDVDFEVPALDRAHAFLLNDARVEIGGFGYLIDGMNRNKPAMTGFSDVDKWLAEYDEGRYSLFPKSLMPENFPMGLSDAATVILVAVTILRQQGRTRTEMIEQLRNSKYNVAEEDAFHPLTIAQSETDFWLRSHVIYLTNILKRPEVELHVLSAKMVEKFASFPRRRIPGRIEVRELERLLSMPVWKQRFETYGVWIVTRIIHSLDDHDVILHSDSGELRFAFGETRIAEIETARPRLSIFSERRVSLPDPVGKSRKKSAQPDFGIWTVGEQVSECVLVVEVKHYKKRSRRNFRDVLIDYSKAHPIATVALVNYGPVGAEFRDLPDDIRKRCHMIGPLTPEAYQALGEFRELVRSVVGIPVRGPQTNEIVAAKQTIFAEDQIIALDVSGSMAWILNSNELRELFWQLAGSGTRIAMIDQKLRAIVRDCELDGWLAQNKLGSSTSLADPLAILLHQYEQVVVITDESGMRSLSAIRCSRMEYSPIKGCDGIFIRIVR